VHSDFLFFSWALQILFVYVCSVGLVVMPINHAAVLQTVWCPSWSSNSTPSS